MSIKKHRNRPSLSTRHWPIGKHHVRRLRSRPSCHARRPTSSKPFGARIMYVASRACRYCLFVKHVSGYDSLYQEERCMASCANHTNVHGASSEPSPDRAISAMSESAFFTEYSAHASLGSISGLLSTSMVTRAKLGCAPIRRLLDKGHSTRAFAPLSAIFINLIRRLACHYTTIPVPWLVTLSLLSSFSVAEAFFSTRDSNRVHYRAVR
jgi:hypothetical protein